MAADTKIDPFRYRGGEEPKIGDRLRLVDNDELLDCQSRPVPLGEYAVDDLSWMPYLQVLVGGLFWAIPGRFELIERTDGRSEAQILEGWKR